MSYSDSIESPVPATTSRPIRLSSGVVIPANTDTTAKFSAGNRALVVIQYEGRMHLVPTAAVRFI